MTKHTVLYLGRPVDKDSFRTYIYSADLNQKLVNSWTEFQEHMETGIWFATKSDASASIKVAKEKPKSARKPKETKTIEVSNGQGEVAVKDDFLPTEG